MLTVAQILGPDTTQQEFFECTMKENVRDVLLGENRLLYTYGVSNSGKTYTVQGTGREAGLLPRALVSIFGKLRGRLYDALDLKPFLCQGVRRLNCAEVRAEEVRRDSLLKEEEGSISQNSRLRGGASVSCDSGIGGVSSGSCITTQLEDSDSVCLDAEALSHSGGERLEEGVRFSVWVSFFEIYNEFLYDLLEPPPTLQSRKRTTLRLSDDRHGNPYVKDLTWVQVRSAEEAWKVLRIGRRNQSFASTHLNQTSSRSHSIFSLRLLHINPEGESGHSTHTSESRLPLVVPFRDSKLTRLVHSPSSKTHVAYIQSLLRAHGLQTNESAREEGGECSQAEEGDVTMFDSEELMRAIAVLKQEVQRQREEKEELEARVREQVCSEMMEVIARMENDFSETLESERALMEERYEDKIKNLHKSLKRFYAQEIEASSVCSSSSSSSSFSSFSLAEELSRVQAELDQCRSELQEKTLELRRYQGLLSLPAPSSPLTSAVDRKLEEGQRCLRQLRMDLQGMGRDLQYAERACCHNTSGERLRLLLANTDSTLAKQDQALGELQNSLLLVKMDLRKKTDRLAQLKATSPPRAPPAPGTCAKRGCGGAELGGGENHRPEKRPFLRSPVKGRVPPRNAPTTPATPHSRVLHSHQRSPAPGPAPHHKGRGCVF
ncbi:hypothetical protein SKAU_G00364890 [Synaphobranchus kaupii]|uniref:Kinesin motor domain-containing protein n=1 Tax=Synaphobranchus kaupii TaxID=118154 RepID=A0A9Q1EEV4_SYNKA|nr:hypothetical protein SKAU_G00364890 [Synaphobranchus kaupii]